MFKAPDSTNVKSTASAREAYVKFHDNGQVEFNAAFYEHQLIHREYNTNFTVQWQAATQIMIFAFATEAQMIELGIEKEKLDGFSSWETGMPHKDHKCDDLGEETILWRLKEGDLKKGLTGTIRSCDKKLYPEEGDINLFNEGKNLTLHDKEKYAELNCKNKKTQPSQAKQKKLDEEAKAASVEETKEEVMAEMQEAFLADSELGVESLKGGNFEKMWVENEEKWRPHLDKFTAWAGDVYMDRAKVRALQNNRTIEEQLKVEHNETALDRRLQAGLNEESSE